MNFAKTAPETCQLVENLYQTHTIAINFSNIDMYRCSGFFIESNRGLCMCSKAEVHLFSDASRVVAGFFRVAQYMDSVEMVTGAAMFGPLSISCHLTPSGRSKGYTRLGSAT